MGRDSDELRMEFFWFGLGDLICYTYLFVCASDFSVRGN